MTPDYPDAAPRQARALDRESIAARLRQAPPAPAPEDSHLETLEPAARVMEAAVLVPLVSRPEGIQVLLTQRTAHLDDHAGQICFPGGRAEPGDASRRRDGVAGDGRGNRACPRRYRAARQASRPRDAVRLSHHAGGGLDRAAVLAHARPVRGRRRIRGAALPLPRCAQLSAARVPIFAGGIGTISPFRSKDATSGARRRACSTACAVRSTGKCGVRGPKAGGINSTRRMV